MTKGMTKLVNCDKIAQMNVYYFDEFLWESYGHLLLTIGGGRYGKISA